jgi:hypothetical protein
MAQSLPMRSMLLVVEAIGEFHPSVDEKVFCMPECYWLSKKSDW